jgi:hypothetical protein
MLPRRHPGQRLRCRLLRTRRHPKRGPQVSSRTRQRSDRRYIARLSRRRWWAGWLETGQWHDPDARPQPVNATEAGRDPDRAHQIRAVIQKLSPAATAAAAPPDEPPGVRAISHGLLVCPYSWLAVCAKSASMSCPVEICDGLITGQLDMPKGLPDGRALDCRNPDVPTTDSTIRSDKCADPALDGASC